jgi:hypothetical protein
MCEPTSLAAAATYFGASAGTVATIGTVGSVASAIGTGLSVVSSYQQAKGQQAQLEYQAAVDTNNAKVAEYKAQDAQNRGELEAQRIARAAGQLKGSQRTAMAARGLDLGEGTAFALQEQTDIFSLYDQATARENASKEAYANRTQGANYTASAAGSRAAAGNINPGMAAVGTLLSSAGRVASKWNSYGGTGPIYER